MDAQQLTWSQAITWTHTGPSGFSGRHRAEQHFATSMSVGTHIARLVFERCRAAAKRHHITRPWIVDVGSGNGALLRQLLALGFPADRLLGIDVRQRPPDLPVNWIRGVAPDCVPPVAGLIFAHEFLDDVPADWVVDGRVQTVDAQGRSYVGGIADPADLSWLRTWAGGDTGLVGRQRDEVWVELVDRVRVGEAIAVDFGSGAPVGHRAGRRCAPVPDGLTDISAGVELRSCRTRTGGRLIPQHRLLADRRAVDVAERAELAVLRDRAGFGAFNWLISDVASIGSPA